MMAARAGVHRIDGDGQVRSTFQNAGTFTTGTDEPSTNNAYRRLRFPVPASTQASELVLTIELSNHATSFLSAGVFGSPTLYDSNDDYQTRIRRWGGYLFSLGVCFMIGLYHLIVYFFRRRIYPRFIFPFAVLRMSVHSHGNLAVFWAELGLLKDGEDKLRISDAVGRPVASR